MTCLYTVIGERVESVKGPSQVSSYQGRQLGSPQCLYQYRNVSECSLFYRYVIQVFKDFVAEGCGVYDFIAEGRMGNN